MTPSEQQDNNIEENNNHTNDEQENTGSPLSTRRNPPNLNTTNLRTNVTYGSEMELPKPPNTTWLLDLNINGLRHTDEYQDVLENGQALKMNSVDIFAFQETDTDWRSKAKSKTYEHLQKVYHHVRVSTSSSTMKFNMSYQPGGTLTAVTDNYVGRVTEIGLDKEMGRWRYICVLGKGDGTLLSLQYTLYV
jgi:hypothetical protein